MFMIFLHWQKVRVFHEPLERALLAKIGSQSASSDKSAFCPLKCQTKDINFPSCKLLVARLPPNLAADIFRP